MAAPGYSVSELIKAAKFCLSVFDAFFDQYDNAPARLRELAQLIQTFREILEQNQETLKRKNTSYPGHDGLKRTLEACERFIKKFKSVCDGKGHGARKLVFTAIFPAYSKTVADLDRQLMRHALPMLLWNSNSLLKWAFEQGEEVPVIPQPDVRLADASIEDVAAEDAQEAEGARVELDRFRKEMAELQSRMPRPLQRHVRRTVFFREFHDIVRKHWNNLSLPADELLDIFGRSDTPEEDATSDATDNIWTNMSR
ncbi:hypothetical protein EJ04DRAFT_86396 [Polyplosphaeria fusca]|uniref:Uncharacterized protein n=1 Tax=Polyplosphaeria fusca TaxID=682080 RepID=A0A9P4UY47_9PLEO|nr:hypothetical protein EJ04DRAFT_86396 [Polyplosphaeria fusca]